VVLNLLGKRIEPFVLMINDFLIIILFAVYAMSFHLIILNTNLSGFSRELRLRRRDLGRIPREMSI